MKTTMMTGLALLIGGVLGFSGNRYLLADHTVAGDASSPTSENEPLYWVAPMDPNYRRDAPGKSPMGMDLIPIYEEEISGDNENKGTVKINPAVENNLGVKTASVTLDKLAPQIETVGYIAFDESRLWQTNSRVSGWVEALNIDSVGEEVKRGKCCLPFILRS